MKIFNSPDEYVFNLHTTSSTEARRMWRKSIKEKWNNQCAYCGSQEDLNIDHIIPQSRGGNDFITNVICCCVDCNQCKGHQDWEIWYESQEFFTYERKSDIIKWQKQFNEKNLVKYKPRRNNAS